MLKRILDMDELRAKTDWYRRGLLERLARARTDTKKSVGSVFTNITNPDKVLELVFRTRWTWNEDLSRKHGNYDYWHADVPGMSGVHLLGSLHRDREVLVGETAGGQMCVLLPDGERSPVEHSTLITYRRWSSDIVATFHPGDPIFERSGLPNQWVGHTITVRKAIELGFLYALVKSKSVQESTSLATAA